MNKENIQTNDLNKLKKISYKIRLSLRKLYSPIPNRYNIGTNKYSKDNSSIMTMIKSSFFIISTIITQPIYFYISTNHIGNQMRLKEFFFELYKAHYSYKYKVNLIKSEISLKNLFFSLFSFLKYHIISPFIYFPYLSYVVSSRYLSFQLLSNDISLPYRFLYGLSSFILSGISYNFYFNSVLKHIKTSIYANNKIDFIGYDDLSNIVKSNKYFKVLFLYGGLDGCLFVIIFVKLSSYLSSLSIYNSNSNLEDYNLNKCNSLIKDIIKESEILKKSYILSNLDIEKKNQYLNSINFLIPSFLSSIIISILTIPLGFYVHYNYFSHKYNLSIYNEFKKSFEFKATSRQLTINSLRILLINGLVYYLWIENLDN